MSLKYINKILLAFLITGIAYAQDTEADSSLVVSDINDVAIVQKDTVKQTFKRFKTEGVSAVVGEFVVLSSDIDKGYVELKQQGISIEDITRCQLLGKLMEDKLYAHQAKVDSILVPDSEINQNIDQQLDYMLSQLGSEEKLVAFYRKDNMADLRKELFEANKTNILARRMQTKITEAVEITPEETRQFFFGISEEDRPIIGTEVEVSQIVIKPEITEAAKQDVIDRLNTMRADIVDNGASFATKAILYSKDGSAANGGILGSIRRDSPYAKEFKDVAFTLLEGEVSEPFETEFGYHILYVEKIRGQELDVRHIILIPDVSQEQIDAAKTKLDSIRTQVVGDKIKFVEAAQKFSDEKETKNNGGILRNPITNSTRFDLSKMEPTLAAQVYNLEEGEVSKVFSERDRSGRSFFKVITVNKKYPDHKADYKKDYEKVKDLALQEKQIKAVEKWQEEKIAETYIHVNEDFQECEFSSNWIKK